MLERAVDRVTGRVSITLHQRAARRLPQLVEHLMTAALERWAANDWHTFDHLEVNCTAQLYRWLSEAQRADAGLAFLSVQIEHLILTPAMWAGDASVTTAHRPDIRLSIGQAGVAVEAKRLVTGGSWSHKYVHNGMARFVSSSYGAGEPSGLMVGYVQGSPANGILPAVNAQIEKHPLMGKGHQLNEEENAEHGTWYQSNHVRAKDAPIRLLHLWVVLGTPTSLLYDSGVDP